MLTADHDRVAAWRAERAAIAAADATEAGAAERDRLLHARATATRRSVVRMIQSARLGHIGGDFSVTDILTALFFDVLNLRPEEPDWAERDRFVLSKGHCAAALYSTLTACGYFPESELASFMQPLSALNGHPNRTKVPGVETNTGPLGHGLPVGLGTAIGAKLRGSTARTVVVTGDGELQEGSNWEALMTGAHRRLDNLTVVVDRNRLQQGARTEDTAALDPLDAKLAAFGWEVREVDGHDFGALLGALRPLGDGRPVAVIANTIKGKGVSFIEDRVEWHHKVPSDEQVELALKELA